MNLEQHLSLLENSLRGHALETAIAQVVGPGATVLDAGCGSGFLSLLAARTGADRVIAVDMSPLTVARELAKCNGVDGKIEFIQGDLGELADSGGLPKFDVILGMVYYNDPRRDEGQSRMMHRLIRQLLRSGGHYIPEKIRYRWQVVDWPAQSWSRIGNTLDARVRRLMNEYDLDFSPLRDAIRLQPQSSWFPRRKKSGMLPVDSARALGDTAEAFMIDYGSSQIRYPDALGFNTSRDGMASTVIWTQELLSNDSVLFSNQSATWLSPEISCRAGSRIRVRLDSRWRRTNVAEANLVEDHE